MPDTDLPDLLDRLGKAALDCRAAASEAHQAIRDLRTATKEAQRVTADMQRRVEDEIGQEIVAHIKEAVAGLPAGMDRIAAEMVEKHLRTALREINRTLADVAAQAGLQRAVVRLELDSDGN